MFVNVGRVAPSPCSVAVTSFLPAHLHSASGHAPKSSYCAQMSRKGLWYLVFGMCTPFTVHRGPHTFAPRSRYGHEVKTRARRSFLPGAPSLPRVPQHNPGVRAPMLREASGGGRSSLSPCDGSLAHAHAHRRSWLHRVVGSSVHSSRLQRVLNVAVITARSGQHRGRVQAVPSARTCHSPFAQSTWHGDRPGSGHGR